MWLSLFVGRWIFTVFRLVLSHMNSSFRFSLPTPQNALRFWRSENSVLMLQLIRFVRVYFFLFFP